MKNKAKPVELNNVEVNDSFIGKKMKVVREKMIPYQWDALNDNIEDIEKSHAMKNFKIAAGLEEGEFKGMVFQDSDFAKWLEAVAYTLTWHKDEKLEKTADQAIEIVVKAQQPDGYLNTYYILTGLDKRWTNLRDNHELYCAGHMIEASVAYYQATGKDELLKAMIKYVDHIDSVFGPEEGKKKGYPGHEIIEMALIRLFYVTKNEKHLNLAKYFIDQRGQQPHYFTKEVEENKIGENEWSKETVPYTYNQAGIPVREQTKAHGHAVRAVYLYSGMADVAKETEDKELFDACKTIWDNMINKQMYITGAIGSTAYGEAFTYDYDLPNDTVYAETCASIGLIFFARRMLEHEQLGQYADVMEKALYNTAISGMNLEGNRYFYVNPLEVVPEASQKDHLREHVKVERQTWFACACCPPNLARLLASIGNYIYMTKDEDIFVNLYIGGEAKINTENNFSVLDMKSNMPWDGDTSINISAEKSTEFALALRIPSWTEKFSVKVNEEKVKGIVNNGYLYIKRDWSGDNRVEIKMDTHVKVVESNPKVRENTGKVAITRGPLVYCIEEPDNGKDLHLVRIPENIKFKEEYREDILDGIVVLNSNGLRIEETKNEELYYESSKDKYIKENLTWIPYYSWANREPGEMMVWVRKK